MKQPRKDVLREQLALAADEIIRLRVVIDTMRFLDGLGRELIKQEPWWRRMFRRGHG